MRQQNGIAQMLVSIDIMQQNDEPCREKQYEFCSFDFTNVWQLN